MAPDDIGRAQLLRAIAPFALATLLGFALVGVTTRVDVAEFVLALALTGVVVAAAARLPWRRLPTAVQVLPSLLYLVAMALLRDAGGGTASGVGALVLLPVFWMSLHGTRGQLATVVAGVALFYLAPILLIGGAEYPAAGYRTAVVLVAISAIVGPAVQQLVRTVRAQAASAERHTHDLEQVAAISRRIALSSDARADVCAAACELSDASFAFLMEPVSNGLVSTAMVGLDAPQVVSGALEDDTPTISAFTDSVPVFLPDLRSFAHKNERLWAEHGRPAAMLFEPILDHGRPVGVLVLGWAEGRQPRRRPGIVTLLAAEAAHAIQRADLVSELSGLASTDGLTGLLNRRAWDQRLGAALADVTGQPVSIALLDLDNFKAFNDTHGHQAGDALLQQAAEAWRGALRPRDSLARYGGEEFAVLLPTCDLALAVEVLERLRAVTPGSETCSAGVAQWDGSESGAELLARADRALYAAKAAGRDRAVPA